MKTLVTGKQMKALDQNTIIKHQMPSLVLMERASLAVVEVLEQKKETLGKILVVCGMGNNGGDGIAIARILHTKGYQVSVHLVGDPSRMTGETRTQEAIARSYQVGFVNNPAWEEYTTIVDAIFGVGLERDVSGDFASVIEAVNGTRARKVAVDLPSGICADTGQVLGTALRCQETVTFAFGKPGLYLYPGCLWAGEVTIAEIGIGSAETVTPEAMALEEEDLPNWLPPRAADGNKGTFGKALLVVSQKGMAGAGLLAAQGCFATGTGMVKLHTEEANRLICQTALPEAMVSTWEERPNLERLDAALAWCDAVLIGPGLGTGNAAETLLLHLLRHWQGAMALDADALHLLALHPDWKTYLDARCVLTPHMGEMSRLTGIPVEKLKQDALGAARTLQKETGAVCVLKDARTWIAAREGCYLNLSGCDGMATAGSGDVLSGMITGFLAGGLAPEKAAVLGTFLHGLAGEEAARRIGKRGMKAGDIPAGLHAVLLHNEEQ